MVEAPRQRQTYREVAAFRVAAWMIVLCTLAGCPVEGPRSGRSFVEIKNMIEDKNAADVVRLLGEPDTRQKLFDSDERWIWWSYTSLEGQAYPPEIRGRVVHLEIIFRNPSRAFNKRQPYSEWPIIDAFGIQFKLPSQGD